MRVDLRSTMRASSQVFMRGAVDGLGAGKGALDLVEHRPGEGLLRDGGQDGRDAEAAPPPWPPGPRCCAAAPASIDLVAKAICDWWSIRISVWSAGLSRLLPGRALAWGMCTPVVGRGRKLVRRRIVCRGAPSAPNRSCPGRTGVAAIWAHCGRVKLAKAARPAPHDTAASLGTGGCRCARCPACLARRCRPGSFADGIGAACRRGGGVAGASDHAGQSADAGAG